MMHAAIYSAIGGPEVVKVVEVRVFASSFAFSKSPQSAVRRVTILRQCTAERPSARANQKPGAHQGGSRCREPLGAQG